MYLLKPKQAALLNSIILILIGVIGYYYNSVSITALIPVYLGLAIFLCYVFYDKNHKIFAHIGVILMFLSLLGLFKPLMGLIDKSDLYGIFRIILMQLTSFYCIVCFIASFIEARKNNN